MSFQPLHNIIIHGQAASYTCFLAESLSYFSNISCLTGSANGTALTSVDLKIRKHDIQLLNPPRFHYCLFSLTNIIRWPLLCRFSTSPKWNSFTWQLMAQILTTGEIYNMSCGCINSTVLSSSAKDTSQIEAITELCFFNLTWVKVVLVADSGTKSSPVVRNR